MNTQKSTETMTIGARDFLTVVEMAVIVQLTMIVSGHREDAIAATGRDITRTWMESTLAPWR